MADKVLDGPGVIGQLFRKGECLSHQTRDALAQEGAELKVESNPKNQY
jgi:hypothetical protein